jgi:hypothetical protein
LRWCKRPCAMTRSRFKVKKWLVEINHMFGCFGWVKTINHLLKLKDAEHILSKSLTFLLGQSPQNIPKMDQHHLQ